MFGLLLLGAVAVGYLITKGSGSSSYSDGGSSGGSGGPWGPECPDLLSRLPDALQNQIRQAMAKGSAATEQMAVSLQTKYPKEATCVRQVAVSMKAAGR